jgi:sulfoxide reductase heme-binding subunit YedZ
MTGARAMMKRWQPALIWTVYVAGLLPAAWYFWQGAMGRLGADPIKAFEQILGLWALRFLLLTLGVTFIRDRFGFNFTAYRRALGLLCFYYVAFHFTVYLVLDMALDVFAVLQDVLKRPFIMFGMAGLVMMVPLALTSNRFSIRKMGKKWNTLHRLVYGIAALAILHYVLAHKVFSVEQLVYVGLIIAMMLHRSFRSVWRTKKIGLPYTSLKVEP